MDACSVPDRLVESRLRDLLKTKLFLKITDNTKSMISVKWRNGGCVLRLHRMFLGAAEDVLEALARFIRRPSLRNRKTLHGFIKKHEKDIRVSAARAKPRRPHLRAKGMRVDLGRYFQGLNEGYFGGSLACAIGWGRRRKGRRPKSIRLGSYCPDQEIIKIHPVLDCLEIPDFVIQDVLYHEMLHHELGSVRRGGRRFSHHKEFKSKEEAFPHNARAREWIQSHLSWLLNRASNPEATFRFPTKSKPFGDRSVHPQASEATCLFSMPLHTGVSGSGNPLDEWGPRAKGGFTPGIEATKPIHRKDQK